MPRIKRHKGTFASIEPRVVRTQMFCFLFDTSYSSDTAVDALQRCFFLCLSSLIECSFSVHAILWFGRPIAVALHRWPRATRVVKCGCHMVEKKKKKTRVERFATEKRKRNRVYHSIVERPERRWPHAYAAMKFIANHVNETSKLTLDGNETTWSRLSDYFYVFVFYDVRSHTTTRFVLYSSDCAQNLNRNLREHCKHAVELLWWALLETADRVYLPVITQAEYVFWHENSSTA